MAPRPESGLSIDVLRAAMQNMGMQNQRPDYLIASSQYQQYALNQQYQQPVFTLPPQIPSGASIPYQFVTTVPITYDRLIATSEEGAYNQISAICRLFQQSNGDRSTLARMLMRIAYENDISLTLTPNVPMNEDLRDPDQVVLPLPDDEEDRCKRLIEDLVPLRAG
jgi:hypothetical protein